MPLPFLIVLALYGVAAAFLVPIFMGVVVAPVLPFHWHKALHVLGAVLMVGNALVTGAWVAWARLAGSWEVIRFGLRTIIWADVFFTAPGFLLLTSNGLFLASTWGGIYAWSWLTASLVLLAAIGLLGAPVLWLQLRLWHLAGSEVEPPELADVLRPWNVWGSAVTLPLFVILFLMVLRPRLW